MTHHEPMAVRCKNCGKWRACLVRNPRIYVFKCHYCKKGTKLKKAGEWGLSLQVKRGFKNPHELALVVKVLNEEGR